MPALQADIAGLYTNIFAHLKLAQVSCKFHLPSKYFVTVNQILPVPLSHLVVEVSRANINVEPHIVGIDLNECFHYH